MDKANINIVWIKYVLKDQSFFLPHWTCSKFSFQPAHKSKICSLKIDFYSIFFGEIEKRSKHEKKSGFFSDFNENKFKTLTVPLKIGKLPNLCPPFHLKSPYPVIRKVIFEDRFKNVVYYLVTCSG